MCPMVENISIVNTTASNPSVIPPSPPTTTVARVYEMPSDNEEEGEGGPADEEEHPTPRYRGVCWRKREGR